MSIATETVRLPAADLPPSTVTVARWPSEIPLLCLVAIASFWIWLALTISIFGILYAGLLGLFFFVSHVAFVTYVRGSAVRLSTRQFPALYARVVELSRRAGLEKVPDAYLMEAGGSLNAFATKLFRSRMIVLFSDLLEACGDDETARDMVIGHELGHLRSRHLDYHWLLLPGLFVPFLGSAYSRARELTCDRWGAALCGDASGAARGLAVLAAGGRFGPKIDLAAYVDQRRDLDTGWLTLGRWLAPYPPLSKRVELLRPELAPEPFVAQRGIVRAAAILVFVGLLPTIGMGLAFWKMTSAIRALEALRHNPLGAAADPAPVSALSENEQTVARLTVEADFARFHSVFAEEWREKRAVPADDEAVAELWQRRRPGEELPTDPFTGAAYAYYLDDDNSAMVYSAGPDGETATDDDIDHPILPEG